MDKEPSPAKLLLRQFSEDQCRSLFPKSPSKQAQKEIEELKAKMEQIKKMDPGKERKKQEVAVERMFKLMQKQHGTKGLRIDLQIKDPFSNQEIWIDVTCIHPTVKTRIQTELKQTKKEIIFEDDRKRGINNHGQKMEIDGNAARQQMKLKHKTYAPLITIAKKQVKNGMRHCGPKFGGCVATTHGELGLETIKLQEYLTWNYGKKLAMEGHRDNGKKISTLTAEYRNDFRVKIMMAIAKGQARMLNTTGLPMGTCKKYSAIGR